MPAGNRAWLCSTGAREGEGVGARDRATTIRLVIQILDDYTRERLTLRLRSDLVGLECRAKLETRYTHGADPPFQPSLDPPSGRWPGRSKSRGLVQRVSREGSTATGYWARTARTGSTPEAPWVQRVSRRARKESEPCAGCTQVWLRAATSGGATEWISR